MSRVSRGVRGFRIFEHGVGHDYNIYLDKYHCDYEKIQGSDVENHVVRFCTDDNGFICPSKVHDDADLKIVFMGDSTIECTYVDQENRIPYRVGRILEKLTQKKVNSYNAGVSSASTLSLIKVLLLKIFPMHPNIVFLSNTCGELNHILKAYDDSEDIMLGHPKSKYDVIYSDNIFYSSIPRKLVAIIRLILPNGAYMLLLKMYLFVRKKCKSKKTNQKIFLGGGGAETD